MSIEPLPAIPNPTPDSASARAALDSFLAGLSGETRVVALHDCDADGVTAGVVWQRAMERLGFRDVARVIPDRERSAWSESNRARAAAAEPDALFVLDLGSQPVPVLPGVPTCYIDHHRPEGIPPGDTLISAYSWDPIPNTSLLVHQLFEERVGIDDLDWVAVIGALSDLGDHPPFPIVETTKKRYTAKWRREATTLVYAARRSSAYIPDAAARALLAFSNPREMVEADTPDLRALRVAREEVKGALAEAKRAAPIFSGPVALIRVHSRCQIHPLIAQIWRSRLPKYIVIAANDAYMPGRVSFSVRGASGTNVLEFLRGIDLPEGEGHFGHGHDQASGGSLSLDRWNALLGQLGFDKTNGSMGQRANEVNGQTSK
jgi:single-stranded-DNA-specific exonuclease